jgi:single-strand DNA-binding protein
MSVNKHIILGNVGKVPEQRFFPSGDKYSLFSVATNEYWTDRETSEKKSRTDWHRIVVRGKLSEVVQQYVKEGDEIYIEGSARTRSYQSGQNKDVTLYTTEVFATTINLLRNGHKAEQTEYHDDGDAAAGFPADLPPEDL